ncbi:LysR substrate-binding domain-containing protein [uncultured Nostoc sp.]|uniref:LysR family transcriptional regulator n=1 Tax=uncultured Nostoc sp. TaxID=340711 RepID=UPI0035CADDF5
MDDRFELIRSFVVVAQKLSFVEAADSLQIDPSALSRRIRRLEKRLGVRLFNRNTRRVRLTEAGILYLSHSQEVLAKLDQADALVSHLSAEPRGLLRVTLPVVFGQRQIAPVLPEFLDRYPQINLDLSFTDRFVDVLEESIDVAIRIGQLQDSQLVVRRLAPNRRVLCASPTYLQKYGSPQTPKELEQHSCLNFSRLATGDIWHLSRQNQRIAVPVKGKLRADNAEALYQAVLGGCGIALLATYIAGDPLRTGRLKTVLDDWKVPTTDIFAVSGVGQYTPSKTQVFVDFLVERFRPTPDWDNVTETDTQCHVP